MTIWTNNECNRHNGLINDSVDKVVFSPAKFQANYEKRNHYIEIQETRHNMISARILIYHCVVETHGLRNYGIPNG